MDTPKVFISYSWSTPEHQDWVINLAEKLSSDGVEVVIDKWDLKEGQDKFNFMETMVKSGDILRVLMILDKRYSEKAEERKGGVGTEAQIISPKIYADVSQEKFVPIVSERDENGNPYLPTFINGSIYIDLSEQENFEENYEKLLRNIYERPEYSRPKLGKPPTYLFDETPLSFKTSNALRSFDNQISKRPERINAIIRDFLNDFYENLKEFHVKPPDEINSLSAWGKQIYDSIYAYTPLRNEYIEFIGKVLKSDADFDSDMFIKFFETLPSLTYKRDGMEYTGIREEFFNFKFFIYEIFLYTVAQGLKFEKYTFIEELFKSNYFFFSDSNTYPQPKRFNQIYAYGNIDRCLLNYYLLAFSRKPFSPSADLIVTRIPEGFTKTQIVHTDLICHHIGILDELTWFPLTYTYEEYTGFDFIHRLISLKHFEKVKRIFNVSTVQELKDKMIHLKAQYANKNYLGYPNSFESIIPMYELIEIDKIGSIR